MFKNMYKNMQSSIDNAQNVKFMALFLTICLYLSLVLYCKKVDEVDN